MWDYWFDVETVTTDAVIRGLYCVGSRCVLRNDRATYPGPTLLCRWWFRIDAGADTQDRVFWLLICHSIVYSRPV